MPNEWSFRIPFALQWVWPIPLALLAYFAPESPWFLVRTNQLDKAKRSLERLSEPSHNVNLDATLAMMVHTDKVEKEERAGVSYWECFRGTNLRRTEIACMSFISQITNGGALCYGGTFFFQQTGIPDNTAYYIGLGGTGIAFVGTCISWLYIHRFGRRIIWLTGFATLTAILWTIGILASVPRQTLGLAWGQSLLCVVWLAAYSMSVGPIVYTIVAEVGSTRLRTHTVVLARSFYYVGNIICGGTLQPRMLAPGAWNWRGKTAYFWAVLATLTFVWGYFRMFETKDRTFGDMDYMVSLMLLLRPLSHVPFALDLPSASELTFFFLLFSSKRRCRRASRGNMSSTSRTSSSRVPTTRLLGSTRRTRNEWRGCSMVEFSFRDALIGSC